MLGPFPNIEEKKILPWKDLRILKSEQYGSCCNDLVLRLVLMENSFLLLTS